MSVKLMSAAWAVDLSLPEKLVLLALADSANDEGMCWPSVTSLYTKCSLSERAVRKAVGSLESKGQLTIHQRTGRSNYYTVHPLQDVHPCTACTPAPDAPTPAPDAPPPLHVVHPTPAPRAPITIIEPSSESSGNHHSVAKPRDEGPVKRVFDHWCREFKHPRAVLDPKRRRTIQRALEAHDEESVKASISGYLLSPHHMGQNDQRAVYDDISLFLRDAEHVERGLNFARAPPVTVKSAVEQAREDLRKTVNGHGNTVVSEQRPGASNSDLGSFARLLR